MTGYREYRNAKPMPARDLRRGDVICIPEGVYRVLAAPQYEVPAVGPFVHIQVTTLYGVSIGGVVRLPWERVDCVQWTREESSEQGDAAQSPVRSEVDE